MKTIKLNWGTGIAVSYLGFVAMILTLVTMSMRENIDLVSSQYYVEELKFQNKINKIKSAQSLSVPLTWSLGEKGVEIRYPQASEHEPISGTIKFYSPANIKNDREFQIKIKSDSQLISFAQVPEGRYKLQIDWQKGKESFWNEGVIVIEYPN
jgi:nitrogen fixation protein FixH